MITDDALLALARSGGDCTAELQSRIAFASDEGGGLATLPRYQANYKITDTLNIPPGVSFVGPSNFIAVLIYSGDDAVPAIRIDRNFGYRLGGFTLRRLAFDGLGIGTEVVPDPDAVDPGPGTVSGDGTWHHMRVEGFDIGAQLGSPSDGYATSEIHMDHCQFRSNASYGVKLDDPNTLNITATNLNISSNGAGWFADTGGRFIIMGGTASSNTEFDFKNQYAFGAVVAGFRSEECKVFYIGGGTVSASGILLSQCDIVQRTSPGDYAVKQNGGGRMILHGCSIRGGVQAAPNGGAGSVAMVGCMLTDTVPMHVGTLGADPDVWVSVKGCSQVDNGGLFVGRFADFEGLNAGHYGT